MFTLKSPHGGDSNGYTQYTIFQYKKAKNPKLSQICSYGIFSKGFKNEFERAMVSEPTVFEPLKFYCIENSKNRGQTVPHQFSYFCLWRLININILKQSETVVFSGNEDARTPTPTFEDILRLTASPVHLTLSFHSHLHQMTMP